MEKTHDQSECPKCGLWFIWTPKSGVSERDAKAARARAKAVADEIADQELAKRRAARAVEELRRMLNHLTRIEGVTRCDCRALRRAFSGPATCARCAIEKAIKSMGGAS